MTFTEIALLATITAGAALCWWARRELEKELRNPASEASQRRRIAAAKRDHQTWANTIGAGPVLIREPRLTEEDIIAAAEKKGVPQKREKAPQPPRPAQFDKKDDVPLSGTNGKVHGV